MLLNVIKLNPVRTSSNIVLGALKTNGFTLRQSSMVMYGQKSLGLNGKNELKLRALALIPDR